MKRLWIVMLIWLLLEACAVVSPATLEPAAPPQTEDAVAPPQTPPGYLTAVEEYLVEQIGLASFGGKVFCAWDLLEEAQRSDGVDLYVWALCAEYYLEGKTLTMGTASSLPVALHLQKSGNEYAVISHEIPLDGVDYWPSIQRIFPPQAIANMCEEDIPCYNERAERLEQAVFEKAKAYYGVK
jgi:hypothetical protein